MGRYRVTVEGAFSASHQLKTYDGLLEPMHGHRFRVQARLVGERLDEMGVLMDFVQVEKLLNDVLTGFHDRHLNDLPDFGRVNPSAENVARAIFESLCVKLDEPRLLERVTVWEAPNCSASYSEEA